MANEIASLDETKNKNSGKNRFVKKLVLTALVVLLPTGLLVACSDNKNVDASKTPTGTQIAYSPEAANAAAANQGAPDHIIVNGKEEGIASDQTGDSGQGDQSVQGNQGNEQAADPAKNTATSTPEVKTTNVTEPIIKDALDIFREYGYSVSGNTASRNYYYNNELNQSVSVRLSVDQQAKLVVDITGRYPDGKSSTNTMNVGKLGDTNLQPDQQLDQVRAMLEMLQLSDNSTAQKSNTQPAAKTSNGNQNTSSGAGANASGTGSDNANGSQAQSTEQAPVTSNSSGQNGVETTSSALAKTETSPVTSNDPKSEDPAQVAKEQTGNQSMADNEKWHANADKAIADIKSQMASKGWGNIKAVVANDNAFALIYAVNGDATINGITPSISVEFTFDTEYPNGAITSIGYTDGYGGTIPAEKTSDIMSADQWIH